jgi:SHS2 domain-containing protein
VAERHHAANSGAEGTSQRSDGRYQFLAHTADVLVECRARTLRGIFTSAARALYEVAFGPRHWLAAKKTDLPRQVRDIELRADSQEDLLIRWLQELIFLMDVERFVASKCQLACLSPTEVRAHLDGYTCAPEDRETEIKAATYHGVAIRREGKEFIAAVVFDL